MTIITYGGGEILYQIFHAIAMLFQGDVRSLALLVATVGGFWAVAKALFSASVENLLLHYFFPLLVISGLLMIPSGSIHIEDLIQEKSYKVDGVPLFLARFSELISSIGYRMTKSFETVMHVPNDISYNKTGMLFGADTALDFKKYKINNGDLERNLQSFCKQCIAYDLALGKYSMDQLKKTTDLWGFLKENTSKIRMIHYFDALNKGKYLSCKQALHEMTDLFEKEKEYLDKNEALKHLPLTFQALTGLQKESKELIGQQLMLHLLADGFAKNRAYLQQRSTYLVLGSLASSSLVTIRAILETLVYVSFVFVIPFSFFPGGFRILTKWAGLAIWIQLWPPFYAVLNYVQHIVAKGKAQAIFYGLSGSDIGLSIFTNAGLQNLNDDLFALTGYLAASVPFISYAILQGGVQSAMYLVGTMMTPAHSAATSAASEKSAGNYSLANSSFGTTNYENTSTLQKNTAPSLSSGFFSENRGAYSVMHGSDETILRQGNSDLRTSIFSDHSISQSLQSAKHYAMSAVEGKQKSYSESISQHTRNMSDLTEHLANSQNYTENISEREAVDIQQSARYLENFSEHWGKQFGLNKRESFEVLTGAGIDANVFGVGAKLGGTGNRSVSRDEVLSSAMNANQSEEFQTNLQKVQDFAETKGFTSLKDEGMRLVTGYTRSLDDVHSSQEQLNIAQNKLHQVSETAQWADSHSDLVKQSLNQDFVNWIAEKYPEKGGYSRAIDTVMQSLEKQEMIQEFL